MFFPQSILFFKKNCFSVYSWWFWQITCVSILGTGSGDVGVKEVVTKNTRWWSWSNLIYPIPTGVGLTLLAVLQWRRLNKQQPENEQQPIYTRNLRVNNFSYMRVNKFSSHEFFVLKYNPRLTPNQTLSRRVWHSVSQIRKSYSYTNH